MDEKYVNSVGISVGAYDVMLKFFKESANEISGQIKMEKDDVISLRMSPQLAKAIKAMLEIHLSEYEKAIGVIPEPTITTNEVAI